MNPPPELKRAHQFVNTNYVFWFVYLNSDGPLQQGEANTKNTISCEDNCFVDCMTDELDECVEACRRLICPAV